MNIRLFVCGKYYTEKIKMKFTTERFLRIIGVITFVLAILESNEAQIAPSLTQITSGSSSSQDQSSGRGLLQGLGNIGGVFGNLLGTSNQNICVKMGVGRFPKQDDCTKYLDCSKADMTGVYKSCSGTEKFDVILKTCSSKGRCQEEICKGVNGKLYADPKQKSNYYRCGKNQLTRYTCSNGLQYSELANACMQVVPPEDISAEEDSERVANITSSLMNDDMLEKLQKLQKEQ